ncbi:deoxyribodipyrimidine photo-lyase [Shewanella gaetbuli]|uniref:Deoxyribodipyrimidine photo-lyase n=1 Tax=Shewanella gaetbuli TaxID=220752 RepID=A0A9X1ZGJ2_9GAMM|nr:deoxyribodipyrimidine photo-lyase [Shewanella gaetbuli]MCL1141293.1 deoxyribodipyrimidine photo-lyase [Shewanella gaetbuli]
MQNSLIWFRQDLRIHDHPALVAACDYAKQHNSRVYAVYFVTPKQWKLHDVAAIQIDFIERHIQALSTQLAAIGIPLQVVNLADFDDILPWLNHYCAKQDIEAIFAAVEPEFNERQRDKKLIEAKLPLTLIEQDCLFPYGSVLNQSGQMYKVFTPFSKEWKKQAASKAITPLKAATFDKPISEPSIDAFVYDHVYQNKVSSEHWPVGEDAARKRLKDFAEFLMADYGAKRDFPALDATSKLSPYLAIGVLSARQCVTAILFYFPDALINDASPAKTWLNEIIWREFYRHLLVAFEHLSKAQNFNPLGQAIAWRNNQHEFEQWCQGQTGYPIVDAAMRQLNQTGWMHNRLRMVVASFLTKHLLIDWRWGEQYFRQQLIDGDLAANNGGWQWSAGTGCDAQPYFRVFNPMTQSSKFDADAHFIKQYVPEVANWPIKHIHQPHLHWQSNNDASTGLFSQNESILYPKPIVEHSAARLRAIEVLSALKKS